MLESGFTCSKCQQTKKVHQLHSDPDPFGVGLWINPTSILQPRICYDCLATETATVKSTFRTESFFESYRPSRPYKVGLCTCSDCGEYYNPMNHTSEDYLFIYGRGGDIPVRERERHPHKVHIGRLYCPRCYPRHKGRIRPKKIDYYDPEGIHGILPITWSGKPSLLAFLGGVKSPGLARFARSHRDCAILVSELLHEAFRILRPGSVTKEKLPYNFFPYERLLMEELYTGNSSYSTSRIHDQLRARLLDILCRDVSFVMDSQWALFVLFLPMLLPEMILKEISISFRKACTDMLVDKIPQKVLDALLPPSWDSTRNILDDMGHYKLLTRTLLNDEDPYHAITKDRVIPAAWHPDPWFSASMMANSYAYLKAMTSEFSCSLESVHSEIRKAIVPLIDEHRVTWDVSARSLFVEDWKKRIGKRQRYFPALRLVQTYDSMTPIESDRKCGGCSKYQPLENFPIVEKEFLGSFLHDTICFSCASRNEVYGRNFMGPNFAIAHPKRFIAYILEKKEKHDSLVLPDMTGMDQTRCEFGSCQRRDYGPNCLDCLRAKYLEDHLRIDGEPTRNSAYPASYFLGYPEASLPQGWKRPRGPYRLIKTSDGITIPMQPFKDSTVSYNDVARNLDGDWWRTTQSAYFQVSEILRDRSGDLPPGLRLRAIASRITFPEQVYTLFFMALFHWLGVETGGQWKFMNKIFEGVGLHRTRRNFLYTAHDGPEKDNMTRMYREKEPFFLQAVMMEGVLENAHRERGPIGRIFKHLLWGNPPNCPPPKLRVLQDSWFLFYVALGEVLMLKNREGKPPALCCKETLDILLFEMPDAIRMVKNWDRLFGRPYVQPDWERAMSIVEHPEYLSPKRFIGLSPRDFDIAKSNRWEEFDNWSPYAPVSPLPMATPPPEPQPPSVLVVQEQVEEETKSQEEEETKSQEEPLAQELPEPAGPLEPTELPPIHPVP